MTLWGSSWLLAPESYSWRCPGGCRGSNPGQLCAKGKPLPRLMTSFSHMQPPTLPITTTTIPKSAHLTPCRAMAFGWGGTSRAELTPASVGAKLEDPEPSWDGKGLRKMSPPSTHAAAIPLLIKARGHSGKWLCAWKAAALGSVSTEIAPFLGHTGLLAQPDLSTKQMAAELPLDAMEQSKHTDRPTDLGPFPMGNCLARDFEPTCTTQLLF